MRVMLYSMNPAVNPPDERCQPIVECASHSWRIAQARHRYWADQRATSMGACEAGLLGTFLLTLATTPAAPQTQLDELIARAKSLELDRPMCRQLVTHLRIM